MKESLPGLILFFEENLSENTLSTEEIKHEISIIIKKEKNQ